MANKEKVKFQTDINKKCSRVQSQDHKKDLKSSTVKTTVDRSKFKVSHLLTHVRGVLPFLSDDVNNISWKYSNLINKSITFIENLPKAKVALRVYIHYCTKFIKKIRKEEQEDEWKEFSGNVKVKEIEDALVLLKGIMLTIAVDLKVPTNKPPSEKEIRTEHIRQLNELNDRITEKAKEEKISS